MFIVTFPFATYIPSLHTTISTHVGLLSLLKPLQTPSLYIPSFVNCVQTVSTRFLVFTYHYRLVAFTISSLFRFVIVNGLSETKYQYTSGPCRFAPISRFAAELRCARPIANASSTNPELAINRLIHSSHYSPSQVRTPSASSKVVHCSQPASNHSKSPKV